MRCCCSPSRAGSRAAGSPRMHDSGGERELLVDLAAARGVPFARIGAARRPTKLAARLDYGLEPINPLDAWGTGHDYRGHLPRLHEGAAGRSRHRDRRALRRDRATATRSTRLWPRRCWPAAARQRQAGRLATNVGRPGSDDLRGRVSPAPALPVLIRRRRRRWRRSAARSRGATRAPAAGHGAGGAAGRTARATGHRAARRRRPLDEAEGLRALRGLRLPVLPHRIVEDAAAAVARPRAIWAFPLALKTAMPRHPAQVRRRRREARAWR